MSYPKFYNCSIYFRTSLNWSVMRYAHYLQSWTLYRRIIWPVNLPFLFKTSHLSIFKNIERACSIYWLFSKRIFKFQAYQCVRMLLSQHFQAVRCNTLASSRFSVSINANARFVMNINVSEYSSPSIFLLASNTCIYSS
jgi:hypothetical protein